MEHTSDRAEPEGPAGLDEQTPDGAGGEPQGARRAPGLGQPITGPPALGESGEDRGK